MNRNVHYSIRTGTGPKTGVDWIGPSAFNLIRSLVSDPLVFGPDWVNRIENRIKLIFLGFRHDFFH